MKNLLSCTDTKDIIWVDSLKELENMKGLDDKKLCIIKTDFKGINENESQIWNILNTCRENINRSKQQDSYFAMITHDMKGPVQAELSALKYLLDNYEDDFNSEQLEIIQNVFNSIKYLQDLVVNVLQKFKYENGEIKINKQNNSFKVLVTECCEQVKYIAEEKNIEIEIFYNTEVDNICFDSDEIRRVMHNLLTNALKYSFKNNKVVVYVKDDEKNIIVSIKNSGNGIYLKNPDEVFEKFMSFAEQNKSVQMGLGLYISKQIIDVHKGTIKFESIPDKYTTLTFTLPVSE